MKDLIACPILQYYGQTLEIVSLKLSGTIWKVHLLRVQNTRLRLPLLQMLPVLGL